MRNFKCYFEEAYYRLEKERSVTASAYMILKHFTGVSIPKLEAFLKLTEPEEEVETKTVAEIKTELEASGSFVIKRGE